MSNEHIRIKRIPVSEDFGRWVKAEAAKMGYSVVKYTDMMVPRKNKKNRGDAFDFSW